MDVAYFWAFEVELVAERPAFEPDPESLLPDPLLPDPLPPGFADGFGIFDWPDESLPVELSFPLGFSELLCTGSLPDGWSRESVR
ncbi:hypothetical protein [Homoserinimonas sp. OAct 916]|uniref:hypothetical protein n=1 Tax=Homoserinimonas sp. OAct 916 TaxID=2211450 RepID=UPI0034CD2958